MSVFIAITTSPTQSVKSLLSCVFIRRQAGDQVFMPDNFGPVFAAKASLCDDFLAAKEYNAILFLDGDQYHPPDMLEKLRESMDAHDLDIVAAHVYRRQAHPIQSLCIGLDGKVVEDVPRTGLHEMAGVSLSCTLIHRRVLEAMQRSLPEGVSPLVAGPVSGARAEAGVFSEEFAFYNLARKLGFRVWLRADVESLHAVTIWLGHDSADALRKID